MPPRQNPPRPDSLPKAEEVIVTVIGGVISPVPPRSPAEISLISSKFPIAKSAPAIHKFPEPSKARSWTPKSKGKLTIRLGFGAPLAARSAGANFHSWELPTFTQRLSDESKRSDQGNHTIEEITIDGEGILLSNWSGGTSRSC